MTNYINQTVTSRQYSRKWVKYNKISFLRIQSKYKLSLNQIEKRANELQAIENKILISVLATSKVGPIISSAYNIHLVLEHTLKCHWHI